MSFRNFTRCALVCAVGTVPFAAVTANAQAPSVASLLSSSVTVLPSTPAKDDNNNSDLDMIADLGMNGSDPLGAQAVLGVSHAGSGLGAGWLLGGVLGAAAGVAGLSGSGGSAAAATPAAQRTPGATIFATGVSGNVASVGASAGSPAVSSAFVGGASAGTAGPRGFTSVTPEPGSVALLGGLGFVLTAVRIRRRKR